MLLEATKILETGAIICYVIEYQGKDSAVVKYEMTPDLIGALRNIAKSDFWLIN